MLTSVAKHKLQSSSEGKEHRGHQQLSLGRKRKDMEEATEK